MASSPGLRGWLARQLGERMRGGASAPTGVEIAALLADCDAKLAVRHSATLLRHAEVAELARVVSGEMLALSSRLAFAHALLRTAGDEFSAELLELLLQPHGAAARPSPPYLERVLLDELRALPGWIC